MVRDKQKIIILGSHGFIGSHLVSWLRSQNYYVVGIDRVIGGDLTLGLKKTNKFIQLDLPDRHFEEILGEIKPTAVINAAGPASVPLSIENPSVDFYGSVIINFTVLETIRIVLPECRYLLLSSAAVYGNQLTLPIKESTTLNPISPYGYHKLICEKLAQEFFNVFGIKTGIVRIFSAYGPGLRKQILWDIYQKVVNNNQVRLFGTGEETRDFIYIKDVAYAIQLILENGVFDGSPYNIANGHEVSIKELARLFLTSFDQEFITTTFSGKTKPGDPIKWCADIEQLTKMGYIPGVTLEQGVLQYADWVKGIIGNN